MDYSDYQFLCLGESLVVCRMIGERKFIRSSSLRLSIKFAGIGLRPAYRGGNRGITLFVEELVKKCLENALTGRNFNIFSPAAPRNISILFHRLYTVY